MRETKVILSRLGPSDLVRLRQSSQEAQFLEDKWKSTFWRMLDTATGQILQHLDEEEELPKLENFDFADVLTASAFDVMQVAMATARTDLHRVTDPTTRLARPPRMMIPKSAAALREEYDLWRNKKFVPTRQKVLAEKIRDAYFKKVRDIWEKHSEAFREGRAMSLDDLTVKMREATKVGYARAAMTVETETTNYYNKIRMDVYDQSPDVVAYLFLAVRDHATTKWCRSRNGLVYHRDDPRCKTECPACHWNCRSEMLPLTRFNPRHLAFINDTSLDRRNNQCEPLPRGWRSA